jgi:hypothetical protein
MMKNWGDDVYVDGEGIDWITLGILAAVFFALAVIGVIAAGGPS